MHIESTNRKTQLGFTLVEIMVALVIFSVIGLISARLLSQSLESQNALQSRGERLAEIHRALRVVQRDMLQFSARSIRVDKNEYLPPLLLSPEGALEMTRVGWRNPLGQPRSEVQRLGYRWQDEKLIRGYWLTLDRSYEDEPAYQTVLSDVTELEFYAIDNIGNQHDRWPLDEDELNDMSDDFTGLVAILMRVEIEPFGFIERLWQIPPLKA